MDEERLNRWIAASFYRWSELIDPLSADVGPRFPHGYYNFAYEITGDARQTTLAQLPDVIRASVVRHTGWPPFWYPTREGIQPYPVDGAVECWLGDDPGTPAERRDPAHADFWRITPDGCAYLLRGYQEDSGDQQWAGQGNVEPGTGFDVTLPVWRVGETLLQAEALIRKSIRGTDDYSIRCKIHWSSGSLIGEHRWEKGYQGRPDIAPRVELSTNSC